MPDTLTRTMISNTIINTTIITSTVISPGSMLIHMITQTIIHTTDMQVILRRHSRTCIRTAGERTRICRRGPMVLL